MGERGVGRAALQLRHQVRQRDRLAKVQIVVYSSTYCTHVFFFVVVFFCLFLPFFLSGLVALWSSRVVVRSAAGGWFVGSPTIQLFCKPVGGALVNECQG